MAKIKTTEERLREAIQSMSKISNAEIERKKMNLDMYAKGSPSGMGFSSAVSTSNKMNGPINPRGIDVSIPYNQLSLGNHFERNGISPANRATMPKGYSP